MVLFIRTRRWPAVVATIAAAALLTVACGPLAVALNPTGEGLVRVALLIPLLPAVAIAAAFESALPAQEAVAARRLRLERAAHLVLLTGLAVGLLAGASTLIPAPEGSASLIGHGPISVVRNTLALTGTALLGYRFLGPQAGWVPPVAWVIIPPLLMPRPDQDPGRLFTLVTQPDRALEPFTLALGIWVVALVVRVVDGLARLTPPRSTS
ncbi:hypothetical protein [Agromyces sp. NPDC060279]|uniref:hypothetical protein n=1 Tax=Agromyces sp. NPDC060279 TaxID=3347092 RepID=UPI00365DED61